MPEIYEGELEENWYSQKNGKYRIGEKNLDDILAPYFHSSEKFSNTSGDICQFVYCGY